MKLLTKVVFLSALFSADTGVAGSTIKATEDVQLTASPASMHESFTRELVLNCSLDNQHTGSDLTSLMSLILSKANESAATGYTEIASLAAVSPDTVVVKQSLGAEVRGHLEAKGQSYITYKWQYPTSTVLGEYRCEAFGMEATGHPRTSESNVEITEDRVGVESILSRIKQIEQEQEVERQSQQIKIDAQQSQINSLKSKNDAQQAQIDAQQSQINSQQSKINAQQSQISSQKVIIDKHSFRFQEARKALIQASTFSDGHEYLLSRQIWANGYVADHYCRLFGGYLVEIQDDREFEVVYDLLKQNNAREYIFIGGNDEGHEGRFYYQRSGHRATFLKWLSGQPNDGTHSNCLGISHNLGHGMNDLLCLDSAWYRFVCEIE